MAPWGMSGYIRKSRNGHHESSVSVRRYVELQEGDLLSVECRLEAGPGSVYLIPEGTLFEAARLGN